MGFSTLRKDIIVYKIVQEQKVRFGRTRWLLEMKIPKGSVVYTDGGYRNKHRSDKAIPLRCWKIETWRPKRGHGKVLASLEADKNVYAILHDTMFSREPLWYKFGKVVTPDIFSNYYEQCAGGIHWYRKASIALKWVNVTGADCKAKAEKAVAKKWKGQVA